MIQTNTIRASSRRLKMIMALTMIIGLHTGSDCYAPEGFENANPLPERSAFGKFQDRVSDFASRARDSIVRRFSGEKRMRTDSVQPKAVGEQGTTTVGFGFSKPEEPQPAAAAATPVDDAPAEAAPAREITTVGFGFAKPEEPVSTAQDAVTEDEDSDEPPRKKRRTEPDMTTVEFGASAKAPTTQPAAAAATPADDAQADATQATAKTASAPKNDSSSDVSDMEDDRAKHVRNLTPDQIAEELQAKSSGKSALTADDFQYMTEAQLSPENLARYNFDSESMIKVLAKRLTSPDQVLTILAKPHSKTYNPNMNEGAAAKRDAQINTTLLLNIDPKLLRQIPTETISAIAVHAKPLAVAKILHELDDEDTMTILKNVSPKHAEDILKEMAKLPDDRGHAKTLRKTLEAETKSTSNAPAAAAAPEVAPDSAEVIKTLSTKALSKDIITKIKSLTPDQIRDALTSPNVTAKLYENLSLLSPEQIASFAGDTEVALPRTALEAIAPKLNVDDAVKLLNKNHAEKTKNSADYNTKCNVAILDKLPDNVLQQLPIKDISVQTLKSLPADRIAYFTPEQQAEIQAKIG